MPSITDINAARIQGNHEARSKIPRDNAEEAAFIASAIKEISTGKTLRESGPRYQESVLDHVIRGHIGTTENHNDGQWARRNDVAFNNEENLQPEEVKERRKKREEIGQLMQQLFKTTKTLPPDTKVQFEYKQEQDVPTITIPFNQQNYDDSFRRLWNGRPPRHMNDLYGERHGENNGLGDPRSIQKLKVSLQRRLNTAGQPEGEYRIFSVFPKFQY